MRSFIFEAYTPERVFYTATVQAITLTLDDGDITINAGHNAITAPVQIGLLKIMDEGGVWRTAFVSNGLLEVKQSKTVLLTEAAEWPTEIDTERAKTSLKAAEEQINDAKNPDKSPAVKKKLLRAQARLKVASLV
jgi:F-type H+-transporting ATPase subunit epsilon